MPFSLQHVSLHIAKNTSQNYPFTFKGYNKNTIINKPQRQLIHQKWQFKSIPFGNNTWMLLALQDLQNRVQSSSWISS